MIIGTAANLKNIIRINDKIINRYLWIFKLKSMLLNFNENNGISDTSIKEKPILKITNRIGLIVIGKNGKLIKNNVFAGVASPMKFSD
jgi:hypothetical protein